MKKLKAYNPQKYLKEYTNFQIDYNQFQIELSKFRPRYITMTHKEFPQYVKFIDRFPH